jgi:WD40 repeat protein
VNSLAFDRDRNILVSGSGDGTVRKWDLQDFREIDELKSNAGRVLSVAISPNGQKLAASTNQGKIIIWDLESGERENFFSEVNQTPKIYTVKFHPRNSNRIVSGNNQGEIALWNLQGDSRKPENYYEGDYQQVFALSFTDDGEKLASVGNSPTGDSNITIWNFPEGEILKGEDFFRFRGHDFVVSDVDWSSDSEQLVTSSFDGTVKIWNLESLEEENRIQSFPGHHGFVFAVAFLNSSELTMVSGGLDGTIRILDGETGKEKDRLCSGSKEENES